MPGVVPTINADAFYPCTICGTPGSVVRNAPDLSDKKVKCGDLRCSYVYSAKDSLSAQEAGAIPDAPPEPAEEAPRPEPTTRVEEPATREPAGASATKAPRTPSFVILSKDRTESEFCTKKNLKARVIQWVALGKKFDVFELTSKKVEATLSIQ